MTKDDVLQRYQEIVSTAPAREPVRVELAVSSLYQDLDGQSDAQRFLLMQVQNDLQDARKPFRPELAFFLAQQSLIERYRVFEMLDFLLANPGNAELNGGFIVSSHEYSLYLRSILILSDSLDEVILDAFCRVAAQDHGHQALRSVLHLCVEHWSPAEVREFTSRFPDETLRADLNQLLAEVLQVRSDIAAGYYWLADPPRSMDEIGKLAKMRLRIMKWLS